MSAVAASRVFIAPSRIAHRAARSASRSIRAPVAITAGAPRHSGIVSDDKIHGSSLASTAGVPPPASQGSSAPGAPIAAGVAPGDLVHGSSLAATRLAPTKDPAASIPRSTGKPVAYIAPTCPFAHKAWLALVERDVDFEFKAVDLEDKQLDMIGAYGAASPDAGSVAKVPILTHDGAVMIESALVANYVATTFTTGNDILPHTPAETYKVGLWCETFAVGPPFFKALRATSQADVDAALDELKAALRRCERCLELVQVGDGPFVLGARYSTAEILTSTMLPRISVALGHYRGFRLHAAVEEMGLKRLSRWMEASMERPSMKRTLGAVGEMKGQDVGSAFIDHFAKFVSWKGD